MNYYNMNGVKTLTIKTSIFFIFVIKFNKKAKKILLLL